MVIFGMQIAFDSTQLLRVISSRSRSNIKVTFLKKCPSSGNISASQTQFFSGVGLEALAPTQRECHQIKVERPNTHSDLIPPVE